MNLEETIEVLKNGGTILYPTDTIWGLGCDATNEEACQKYKPSRIDLPTRALSFLADSFQMVEKYIPDFHPVCYDLVDLATRPLTIIYPNAKGIAKSAVNEDGSIGIRITQDPSCLKLIRSIRKPILSTSANLSGEPHPTCFNEIHPSILANVDAVLEERTNENMTTPSQIIKIDLDGSVKVIRK